MNAAHLHLILNHIPVLGSLFGLILLLFGIFRRSNLLVNVALITFLISAAVTLPVDWTGEEAEEILEEMGVDHDIIHEHEEAAELSILLMLVLGGVALTTLLFRAWRHQMGGWLTYLTLVLGMVVFGVMARTANTGGQIRHPEIRPGFQLEESSSHEEEESQAEGEEHADDD